MSKTIFHKVQSLVLIAALAFGQLGVGFFHNKHDAHEKVVDLSHTMLVKHGEHCKVCAVDLIHQFLAANSSIELAQVRSFVPVAFDFVSFTSFSRLLTKDRAPPVVA